MNTRKWLEAAAEAQRKRAFPILSFPAVQLLKISVKQLLGDSETIAEGMKAVAKRTDAVAAVSMMDLSVEAEAFGSRVRFCDDEVPTVVGALVSNREEALALRVPSVSSNRTNRYVEAVAKARREITDRPVFAGMIGPFSLAGRLNEVSEALVNCYEEPEMLHLLLGKATEFLISYAKAFAGAGAAGVVLAEPLTGLLSPDMAEEFSEPYVKRVIDAVQTDEFSIVYHNCGGNVSRMAESIARTGAHAYHFGNCVSMREMLEKFPKTTVLMGNVDPAGQFNAGTPASIREETLRIMNECCPEYPRFLISSGCDIPPTSPWENIDAFFEAVKEYSAR